MKKKIFALFCTAVLFLSAVPTAAALSGEQTRAADTLYTLGLVQGGSGGDYALSDDATRAQAVELLVRLAGRESAAQTDTWISGFRDVPAWAERAVTYASHQGWVTGLDALTFAPDRPVTANAYCAFLLRMLGFRDSAGDFTVSEAALFARHIGLTAQTYTGTLSRGDLFELTRDALTFSYRDGGETVIARLVGEGAVSRAKANALGLLDQELTARQAADRCLAAVFRIDGYKSQLYIDAEAPSSNASGFFISADGLAVTNYHSVSGVVYATATLATGEIYEITRVVYFDADIDIAVIRVSPTSLSGKTASAFATLPLASAKDLRRGDTVYSIGNPLGLGFAVSSGIVSDPARQVERYALPAIMDTADISQGSSGGALLNVYGQVVGVTSGAYAYGNSMYLAVPVDPVLTADLTGEGETLAKRAELDAARAAELEDD